MRNEIKLGLCLLLAIGTIVFGSLAISGYRHLMRQPSDTSESSLTEVPALNKDASPKTKGGYARMMSYGALFVVCAVGLGLMIGHETAHYLGNRVLKTIYNDEGEGIKDPEY